jgi:hypothetical protein
MKRFAIIAVAVLGTVLATAPRAQAADTTCTTTYATFQTVTGNLNVPDNAICILQAGASVTGNVTVGHAATLIIVGGSIAGDIQGNNCGTVALDSVTANGNVQIGNCTGTAAYPYGGIVETSTIGGDFQCHNNTAQFACVLVFSQVHGNAQVMNNVSSDASWLAGNTISNNLECQNNNPAPTNLGIPNTVRGNPNQDTEGQCKGF